MQCVAATPLTTQALRNDLILLLGRPRPPPFAARDDLHPQLASAPATGRMSAHIDRRNIKRFCHRALAAQPIPAPPYVAAATLTLEAYSSDLNPVERLWLYLRKRHLSRRLLNDYDATVEACCRA